MSFQLPCLLDTGATHTLVDAMTAHANGLIVETADNYSVEGTGGSLLPVAGIAPVTFELDRQKVSQVLAPVHMIPYAPTYSTAKY